MRSLQEFFIDKLMESHLYEMAQAQSKCEEKVSSQCKNILENLVLLNYFKISKLNTTNINHWSEELKTAILNAGTFTVKDNDSFSRRKRLIERVFKKENVYSHTNIYNVMQRKLRTEYEMEYEINKSSIEWLDEAIIASINQMDDIKDLIITNSKLQVSNWVNTTFK